MLQETEEWDHEECEEWGPKSGVRSCNHTFLQAMLQCKT